ncbi:MAG: hypothetical protein SOT59_04795 [Eubacteriales bacterium]|nr:hypothetical protein [Eubacteriales bacterium]
MKKYLSIIMVAVLCVLLLVPVGAAAEWVSKDLVSQLDDFPEWVMDADEINFGEQYPGDGMTNAHIGYGSSFNYVYLKADDLGDFTVEFSVKEDGLYNIGFKLMAWSKSVLRSTNVKIDDSEWIYIGYDYNDEDQYSEQYWTGLTMNLTKGTHTCTLSLAPDFDNTNVKSLYFCDLLVGYAGEAAAVEAVAETEAPETEAPETEAPETEAETAAETEAETTAPETEAETETVAEPAETAEETVTTEVTTAPQTFDIAVVAGIAAVVSLAGFAASKKH